MSADQRIRINTGANVAAAAGGTVWTTSAPLTVTRWCETISISPAQAVQRYGCELDAQIRYEFRFFDRPTIGLGTTQFVWVTDGHPNELKIYKPISSPTNVDGVGVVTSLLVEDTGEVASA